MAKSTQKGSKLLVDLMDVIYKSSLAMDERCLETSKFMTEKQLEPFFSISRLKKK
jgi:hypothetical protein